jgi:hypothetical protein
VVKLHVEVIGTVVNAVMDSWTAELGYSGYIRTELIAFYGWRGWVLRLAILWRGTWTFSICDPLRDVLVPLLLGTPLKETDNDHSHVITAHTTCIAVGRQTVIHHVLANGRELLLRYDASPYEFDDSLRRLTIPDSYRILVLC